MKRRPTASVGTPSAFAILVLAAALAVPVKGAASVTFVGFALTQTGAQLNRLSFAVKVKKGKVMGGKFKCAPVSALPSSCAARSGVIHSFKPFPVPRSFAPVDKVKLVVELADGAGGCSYTGSVPFKFDNRVPAISGDYSCIGLDGSQLDAGRFGLRQVQ